jgi:HK97 family phage major capsid protein
MNKRLGEINARKQEIRKNLQDPKMTVDMEAVEKELNALATEQKALEEREKMAEKINVAEVKAEVVAKPEEVKKAEFRDVLDTPEYREAFFNYVKTGKMAPEYRANAVTMTTDVGAAIPTTTLNKIVEKLTSYGMILPLVTKTNYTTGLAIPTSTVKPVATWVAEGATSDTQKKTVGSVVFGAYKLRCAVAVSLETNVRTISAFEAVLVNNVAEAMATALETAIISGTGSAQPKGIITETPVDGQAITVSAIDYDTMVSAEGALPAAYEAGSVWVMSKKTFMSFIGMKDSNKQPIARVNFGLAGAPDRSLLNRKVVICDYLPSFDSAAAGKVFAFIFRMEDYVLNTAYNVTLKQYEDDVTDDIVRKAIMLADGKVVDVNSLVTLVKGA